MNNIENEKEDLLKQVEDLLSDDQSPDQSSPEKEESPESHPPEATAESEEPPKSDEEALHHQSSQENWDKLQHELQALETPEAKLEYAIHFMESSISRSGTPHFKNFWDARALCLSLFKENIPAGIRSLLWEKYTELSKEARRLKEILDEQSAFAAEQIDLAIQAIEVELDRFPDQVDKIPNLRLPTDIEEIQHHADDYQRIQKEMNLLNASASRINSLRKELIKTEMRIRFKNKLFDRLSKLGDRVFPRRKDLIKLISNCFLADVETYVRKHFTAGDYRDSLFDLREQIKELQNMAKTITLNTHAFTHSRLRLSECWDKVKEADKLRKKERAEQKAVFKENVELVLGKISAFMHTFQEGNMPNHQALREIEEISKFMRSVELGRDEVKSLRAELAEAKKPVELRIRAEEEARQSEEQKKEQFRKEKILGLRSDIESLLNSTELHDADALAQIRDELNEKIRLTQMSKFERIDLEKRLKPIRDMISDKKEKALLDLSDDDQHTLNQLRDLLKERKDDRQEAKELLKKYSKESSSGLDIAQAMHYNEMIAAETERLKRLNKAIHDIESRLLDFK